MRLFIFLISVFSTVAMADYISHDTFKLARTEDALGNYAMYEFSGLLIYHSDDGREAPVSFFSECEAVCRRLVPASEKGEPQRCSRIKDPKDFANTAILNSDGKFQEIKTLTPGTTNPAGTQYFCFYKTK